MTEPPLSGPSWLPDDWPVRRLPTGRGFSLSDTCGPVAWAAGRWPDMDWRDGCLIRVANVADGVVPHVVWPATDGESLAVAAPALAPRLDLPLVLQPDRTMPGWDDPIIASLAARFAGLRPFAYGSVYLGLVTSIVGQSISVASAATTQRRLAALLAEPVEIAGRRCWPLPAAEVLATASVDLVRSSGVTWRRAGALVEIARLAASRRLPSDQSDWNDLPVDRQVESLRALPLVGPWTARSALLWGNGEDRVWPQGDVALLRAARLAYDDPGLDPFTLARLAEGWGVAPGWATRLLWAGLFGAAPATMSPS